MDIERTGESTEQRVGSFMKILEEESVFPMQNPQKISEKITFALLERRQIRFGCFVCLPIDLEVVEGLPKYFVGEWKTRLERSKNTKRFQQIVERFKESNFPFSLNFAIADTDIYDIYGEWLRNFDQTREIRNFRNRIVPLLTTSNEVTVTEWSDLQAAFESSYYADFCNTCANIEKYVDSEYLSRSIEKRKTYFESKGLQMNPEALEISKQTAIRNVALYAAQGPIIKNVFDCLIIADPDPLRMGKIQSLLAPDLGIWYPVKE